MLANQLSNLNLDVEELIAGGVLQINLDDTPENIQQFLDEDEGEGLPLFDYVSSVSADEPIEVFVSLYDVEELNGGDNTTLVAGGYIWDYLNAADNGIDLQALAARDDIILSLEDSLINFYEAERAFGTKLTDPLWELIDPDRVFTWGTVEQLENFDLVTFQSSSGLNVTPKLSWAIGDIATLDAALASDGVIGDGTLSDIEGVTIVDSYANILAGGSNLDTAVSEGLQWETEIADTLLNLSTQSDFSSPYFDNIFFYTADDTVANIRDALDNDSLPTGVGPDGNGAVGGLSINLDSGAPTDDELRLSLQEFGDLWNAGISYFEHDDNAYFALEGQVGDWDFALNLESLWQLYRGVIFNNSGERSDRTEFVIRDTASNLQPVVEDSTSLSLENITRIENSAGYLEVYSDTVFSDYNYSPDITYVAAPDPEEEAIIWGIAFLDDVVSGYFAPDNLDGPYRTDGDTQTYVALNVFDTDEAFASTDNRDFILNDLDTSSVYLAFTQIVTDGGEGQGFDGIVDVFEIATPNIIDTSQIVAEISRFSPWATGGLLPDQVFGDDISLQITFTEPLDTSFRDFEGLGPRDSAEIQEGRMPIDISIEEVNVDEDGLVDSLVKIDFDSASTSYDGIADVTLTLHDVDPLQLTTWNFERNDKEIKYITWEELSNNSEISDYHWSLYNQFIVRDDAIGVANFLRAYSEFSDSRISDISPFTVQVTDGVVDYGTNEFVDGVFLSDHPDTLVGGSGNDVLIGFDGDDYLEGGAGDDFLNGGGAPFSSYDGADQMTGGLGNDTYTGGTGPDWYHFADFIPEGGDDVITDFDPSEDRLVLAVEEIGDINGDFVIDDLDLQLATVDQGDHLYLELNPDKTITFLNLDSLIGTTVLWSGETTISFDGDDSADNLLIDSLWVQDIELFGGEDSITIAATGILDADADLGDDNDTFTNNGSIEWAHNIELGAGNDIYDSRSGYQANTYVYGGEGNDTFYNGFGAMFGYGGDGNDTFVDFQDPEQTFFGYVGEFKPGDGTDTIDSTSGLIVVSYSDAPAGITADLAAGNVSDDGWGNLDTLISVENIQGTGGSDTLNLSDDENWAWADSGDDTINAYGGDDHIIPGAGSDTIDGGAGSDWVEYSWESSHELVGPRLQATQGIYADLPNQTVTDAWGDTDILMSVENVTGTNSFGDTLIALDSGSTLFGLDGNDTLLGGSGDDELFGDWGDDVLQGNAGNDNLYDSEGSDTVQGGDGADRFFNGGGDDLLTGGNGGDWFFYNNLNPVAPPTGHDTITDFDTSEDVIYFDGADIGDINLDFVVDSKDVLLLSNYDGTDTVISLAADRTITLENSTLDSDDIFVTGETSGAPYQGTTGPDNLDISTTWVQYVNLMGGATTR